MLPPDPGASSIAVAVRVRPFTIREAAQLQKTDDGTLFLGDGSMAAAPTPKLNQRGLRSVIKVVDDRCLVFDPPEDNPVQKFSRSVVPMGKKVKDQVFAFDRIFDDNASQMDVYEGTTKGLLDSVLDGYNTTVFAYGATGCGKTHTITGTAQQPGIIFLTMQELFEKIAERSDDKHTELTLSYLEIYNETIRDLLVPGGSKQGLMLREDTHHAVTVAGLTSHRPKNVQEVMDMIVQGNEFRTVSPTEANAVSSRSHAVLQINVAQRDRTAGVGEPHTMATLSIIDLAGSERASATKNRGERLLEGANINKSLLALGGCINALCDPRKKNHVPYRNSKLTRLLKFSLGGNCKTVMIVCVSPSSAHFDETQNTLRYANRAKNIQTKVTRNVFNVNRHVKDFLVKIDEQMALITQLRAQQKEAEATLAAKLRRQLERRDAVAREGIQRLRMAYEHAAPERQQKVADMKKLRAVERRIALLSFWVDACDAGGDDDDETALPPAVLAARKSAAGILAELEHSRHHLHQKIHRCNWERPLDSALQHAIAQVAAAAADCAAADNTETVASLTREAELLKANFAREAHIDVLEQEKAAADPLQHLLAAQFRMLAALSETLTMPRDDALAHGQALVQQLLETGTAAACQVIQPDAAAADLTTYPPSKRGTPRRKKRVSLGKSTATFVPPVRTSLARTSLGATSPVKSSSPRRRKPMGAARKGVSFTPVKKAAASKRSVRWRDDESEGTLADFEKTPQKAQPTVVVQEPEAQPEPEAKADAVNEPTWVMDTVPEEPSSPISKSVPEPPSPELRPPGLPVYLSRTDTEDESGEPGSSFLTPPEPASLPPVAPAAPSALTAKPSRFQAGFLTKTRASLAATPSSGSPTLSYQLSPLSESEHQHRSTPLRDMSLPQAANLQQRSPRPTRIPSSGGSPRMAAGVGSGSSPRMGSPRVVSDENKPPSRLPSPRASPSSAKDVDADADTSFDTSAIDSLKLRSAIHSAKMASRRPSTGGASGASSTRRLSGGHRTSGASALASSTNGISRHRRGSAERRRSPPISCLPDSGGSSSISSGGSTTSGSSSSSSSSTTTTTTTTSGSTTRREGSVSRALTPGQARRMNMGGSLRLDSSSGSPRDRPRPTLDVSANGKRRITIGSAAMAAGAKKENTLIGTAASRPSLAWR